MPLPIRDWDILQPLNDGNPYPGDTQRRILVRVQNGNPDGIIGFRATITDDVNATSPPTGCTWTNLVAVPQGQETNWQAPVPAGNLPATPPASTDPPNRKVFVQALLAATGQYDPNSQTEVFRGYQPRVDTTTSMVIDPDASPYGASIALTATVTPADTTVQPSGTVDFREGNNSFGDPAPLDGNGVATKILSNLDVRAYTITAYYLGEAGCLCNNSVSSDESLTVTQATTTCSLTSTPNPSVFGQSVTFTATVTSDTGQPGGSFLLTDDDGLSVPVTVGGAYSTDQLSAGTHSVVAEYQGTTNFAPSNSSPVSQQVNRAETRLALALASSSVPYGSDVGCTAAISVVAPGAGTPNEDIYFLVDSSQDGSATPSGMTAQYTILGSKLLPVGDHQVVARYLGDDNFQPVDSTPQQLTFTPVNCTVILSASPQSVVYGQTVTLQATVAPTSGQTVPTGTVTFADASTPWDPAPLNQGVAQLSTSTLNAGTHTINAQYNPDTNNFNGTTATPLSLTIDPASTQVAVSSNPNPAPYGQDIDFTITVTVTPPGSGTPDGGGVRLLIDGVERGSATLSNGAAQITVSGLTFLAVGDHAVVAEYAGAGNYGGNTSPTDTQTIDLAPTSLELQSSENPSTFGDNVTFTATVTSTSAGTPGGVIDFYVDGVYDSSPAAPVATLTRSDLEAGVHQIEARYRGDGNFAAASDVTISQTVQPASSTTTLISDKRTSVVGETVTFTVTVEPSTATGMIHFLANDVEFAPPYELTAGAGGVAVLSWSDFDAGQYTIVAVYDGNDDIAASQSSSVSRTVAMARTATTLHYSPLAPRDDEPVTFKASVIVHPPGRNSLRKPIIRIYHGKERLGDVDASSSLLVARPWQREAQEVRAIFIGDANHEASSSPPAKMTNGRPHAEG
jgi:hypothetical protein